MSTAIILPSRGLINSHTVEQVIKATHKEDVKFYFSHDNPIPDCFNLPMQKALHYKWNQFFVIIEEDMQVPPDFLNQMHKALSNGHDIAFYDYPLRSGHKERVTQIHSDVLLSGTGLIGFTRDAVEQLFPLRSDMHWTLNPPMLLPSNDATKVYGQHDIAMWAQVYRQNIGHKQLGATGHYSLIAYGKSGVNNGFHQIELLT